MHQIFDIQGRVQFGKWQLPLYELREGGNGLLKSISKGNLNIWVAREENRRFEEEGVLREEEYVKNAFHEQLKLNEVNLVKKNIPLILRESLF